MVEIFEKVKLVR